MLKRVVSRLWNKNNKLLIVPVACDEMVVCWNGYKKIVLPDAEMEKLARSETESHIRKKILLFTTRLNTITCNIKYNAEVGLIEQMDGAGVRWFQCQWYSCSYRRFKMLCGVFCCLFFVFTTSRCLFFMFLSLLLKLYFPLAYNFSAGIQFSTRQPIFL